MLATGQGAPLAGLPEFLLIVAPKMAKQGRAMTSTDLHAWIETSKAKAQDEDGGGLNAADTWVSPGHKYFCVAIPLRLLAAKSS